MKVVESRPEPAAAVPVPAQRPSLWSLIKLTGLILLIMSAWEAVSYLAARLPLPAAAVVLPVAIAAILVVHAGLWRRGPTAAEHREANRVRPLGRSQLAMVLLAVPPMIVATLCLVLIAFRLTGVPPASKPGIIEQVLSHPYGWVKLTLAMGVVAPLIEELMFRGRLQPALERRLGVWQGVLATAIIFAVAHLMAVKLPSMLLLGLVYGAAAALTGSIWAGVILHVANNSLAVLMLRDANSLPEDFWPLSLSLPVLVAALLACLLALTAMGLQLWRVKERRAPSGQIAPTRQVPVHPVVDRSEGP